MSSLVDFEDLATLDGRDLRAVLDEVPPSQRAAAFVGLSAGLRGLILGKLARGPAEGLEAQIVALVTVDLDEARRARRAVVEALCRLGRDGIVAFDDPEDMVA